MIKKISFYGSVVLVLASPSTCQSAEEENKLSPLSPRVRKLSEVQEQRVMAGVQNQAHSPKIAWLTGQNSPPSLPDTQDEVQRRAEIRPSSPPSSLKNSSPSLSEVSVDEKKQKRFATKLSSSPIPPFIGNASLLTEELKQQKKEDSTLVKKDTIDNDK